MKFKTLRYFLLSMACCFFLTHCSKELSPGDYDASEVGKIKKVVPGTIISIRPVRLHSKQNDLTQVSSTHPLENSDMGRGHQHNHGYEYVIRLNSGTIISVVQAEKIKLKNNQRILVISGANTRVVPDNGREDY